jgi:hypothetical protein
MLRTSLACMERSALYQRVLRARQLATTVAATAAAAATVAATGATADGHHQSHG